RYRNVTGVQTCALPILIGDGGEVETVDDGDERVDHLGGGEFEEFELKALHSVVDDASEQPAPPVEDRVDAVLQARVGASGGDQLEPDPRSLFVDADSVDGGESIVQTVP